MIKKILITGSTGFLGSRLAFYLKDRYELLLPTHAELNVSREEALRVYMEENRPDIVLHCAALSNTWYSSPATRSITVHQFPGLSKKMSLFSQLTYMDGINWNASSGPG